MTEGILLILKGLHVTVILSLLSAMLALLAAFAAGLGRLSRFSPVRVVSTTYIEFFRGTSLFVQLFWAFYVLPLLGVSLGPMEAAVLALGLNLGAYGAEVVRGCVQAIGAEQTEACIALNLTRYQRLRHVIIPQALVMMLPPFGNLAVTLLKMTAIASLISLPDLTYQAQLVRSETGQTLFPFAVIMVIYFALSTLIKKGVGRLERRLAIGADRIETSGAR
ncbi:ectoine/hydroxyectoine ABC transporter permease subunit EhuC [Rhodoligotrophos defluvii]|uniref:ectoine/hydroxyectoine ABC transporter permease subunit EhuC n=1 Tax=Rhodoligotrophos defluvii TaxID=2561934 RepID=UPI0010C9FF8B|nr:ectoine/hydroxyectoine ABC transporter permease subunit EhuC [Rhodoligotrophos defluvii]